MSYTPQDDGNIETESTEVTTTTEGVENDFSKQEIAEVQPVLQSAKEGGEALRGQIIDNKIAGLGTKIEKDNLKSVIEKVSNGDPQEQTGGKPAPEETGNKPAPEETGDKPAQEQVGNTNPQEQVGEEVPETLNLTSYEGYIKTIDQLLYEIKGCLATAKYKRNLNQSGKQTLKTAEKKLKQYEQIINGKKTQLEHEYKEKTKLNEKNPDKAALKVEIKPNEINELKNTWFNWKQKIEYDINQGQMGKSSNTAPRPNESREQIIKGNSADRQQNEYNEAMNNALQDAAFLRIMSNNQIQAREFLQGVANNSLTEDQIRFCQANMTQLAPYFEQYGMTTQVHRCIQTRGGRYTTSVQTYENMDGETAYRTGGVVGRLNNILLKGFPNAKPEQVSSLTGLAVAAGGIYAIIKTGKWIFSKDKEGNRNIRKAVAIGAGIHFVPALLTGESGFSLIGDILSGRADFGELRYRLSNCLRFLNNGNREAYEHVAPGMLGMSIFPRDYTVGNVRALQQSFSTSDTARQSRYTSTYSRLNQDSSALATEFQHTFNANRYNENEWKTFLAKIGINDDTSNDALIYNEAAKTISKKDLLTQRMNSQGKVRNKDFDKEIDEYLRSDEEFDPDKLNPLRFKEDNDAKYTNRPEDIENKNKLEQEVNNLPIDSDKKQKLSDAIKRFYDERTINSKPNPNDFSLKIEDGLLVVKSHSGKESKIDLDKKELVGFGTEITFSSLSDLLNAADLTNAILNKQHGKLVVSYPPFQHKIERKGICFNDSATLSWSADTRVLSTGWWGATSKIDALYNYPKEYAQYLSERWIQDNKLEISDTNYPILHDLSQKTGITFTNEQEAKDLEIWLSQIKEGKKFAIGDIEGKPFKISRKFKTLDKRLIFTAVDGTKEVLQEDISEKFPTIMENQEKFLAYMNNQANGMRGSEITSRM